MASMRTNRNTEVKVRKSFQILYNRVVGASMSMMGYQLLLKDVVKNTWLSELY